MELFSDAYSWNMKIQRKKKEFSSIAALRQNYQYLQQKTMKTGK